MFVYNLLDLARTRWEGHALPPERDVVEFAFKYDGLGLATLAFNNNSGVGRGGTCVLKVDGHEVSRQRLERTIPLERIAHRRTRAC